MNYQINFVHKQAPIIEVQLYLDSFRPKIIGTINRSINRFITIKKDEHIFRKNGGFAFCYDLTKRDDIQLFEVRINNQSYFITKEHLTNVGRYHQFPKFEPQIFVSIGEFSHTLEEAVNKNKIPQMELFDEPAT